MRRLSLRMSNSDAFGLSRFLNRRLAVGSAAAIFVLTIALLGGASRADAFSQLPVRVVSIAVIATVLVADPSWAKFGQVRLPLLFLLSFAALILLQLVPLPPQVWAGLPGRQPYLALARLIGSADQWRPLNLTPDLGFNAAMALLPCFAVLALLAQLHARNLWISVAALAIVGAGAALLSLAQQADGVDSALRLYRITSENSAVGLFANRNHNATLLAISLPVIAVCTSGAAGGGRASRMIGFGGIALSMLILVTIPLTGSRFGLVTGLVGAMSALIFWLRALPALVGDRRQKGVVPGLTVLGVLFVVAIVAALTSDRGQALQRLLSASLADDQRWKLWPTLMEMVSTFIPWGSGFGSFEPVFRRFEPLDNLTPSYFNQAHNEFVQLAIEGGLPALLLAVAFLLWWIWRTAAAWRGGAARGAALPQLGSVVTGIIMISSVLDYPVRTPLIAVVFTVAAWWMIAIPALGLPHRKGSALDRDSALRQ